MREIFHGVKGQHGPRSRDWHAEVPMLTRPALKSEKKKLISGVYYYRGVNGRLYVCTMFDFMFGKKGE
jgi:hypothetical protein